MQAQLKRNFQDLFFMTLEIDLHSQILEKGKIPISILLSVLGSLFLYFGKCEPVSLL